MSYEISRSGEATAGPFTAGMNNKSQDHSVKSNEVRNAVNVNFDNSGKGKRRAGLTKVYSASSTKGGYSCEAGEYFIEGTRLMKLNTDFTATELYQGVTGLEFAWFYLLGTVYFSDGTVSLKINDDVATSWGMAKPSTPLIYGTPGAAGTYDSGTYTGCICWVDANGVESGGSPIASVTLPDNTGIIFGDLPVSSDPQVVYLRLYLSTPNGRELYYVADVTPGTLTYTVSTDYSDGTIFDNMFVSPAPAGRIIRYHNARLYVADSSGVVWHTNPFAYDQFHLSTNFLQFPDKVDIMEPVSGGIFFAYGNTTEFYGGDVAEGFEVIPRANYGGTYGSSNNDPISSDVHWRSTRGMVTGSPDGQLNNITEKLTAQDTGSSAAAVIMQVDGTKQCISSINHPSMPTYAATGWIEAEVIRRS